MKFKTKTTLQAYVTSAYYFLEGQQVHLAYDGDKTYSGTDYIEVSDGRLEVVLRVYGMNGTDWSLSIEITRPTVPSFKHEHKVQGTITKNQTDLYAADIVI